MTLNDILVAALAQLDRGHDAHTLNTYRDRLTRYANDAQNDLAHAVGLMRTDALMPKHGVIDLNELPRVCRRVLKVVQLERAVPFRSGEKTNLLLLPYDELAFVAYRYEPKPLQNANDVSELDEGLHGLMVNYVVGRERMAGDVTTQRGSNLYLGMYEAAKAKLRRNMGSEDAYRITNRY